MALDTRQTNNRQGLRWWTCQRCGNDYPETKIVSQKGYILCQGSETNHCVDEYGYQHYVEDLEVPYEKVPETPEIVPWEDI